MTDQDTKTADGFRDGTALVPHSINGMVPLYEDHPPDTYLPMWRCPHCGEHGVTLKDIWRLYRRRERLLILKNEYDYTDTEWSHYNEGIQQTNRELERLTWALPSNVSKWVRENTEPRFWDDSDLNPKNAGETND